MDSETGVLRDVLLCPPTYYEWIPTNDIVRRVYEHRTKATGGFTARYDICKLVWFEIYDDAITAIAREKELKK